MKAYWTLPPTVIGEFDSIRDAKKELNKALKNKTINILHGNKIIPVDPKKICIQTAEELGMTE